MSSFFTTPGLLRKRKRHNDKTTSHLSKRRASYSNEPDKATYAVNSKQRQEKRQERAASINSSDSGLSEDDDSDGSLSNEDGGDETDSSQGEDQDETAADKRLKLAERYLESLKGGILAADMDPTRFDATEIDRELITDRLKEDAAESKGQLYLHIASHLSFGKAQHTKFRADQFGLTAACVAEVTEASSSSSPTLRHIFVTAKDLSVSKWELRATEHASLQEKPSNITPRRKPKLLKKFSSSRKWARRNNHLGHSGPIICATVSQSGKYLVTGGEDKKIVVWDAENLKPVKVFTQHRDAVCALSFRRNTHTLYSASADRTIKIWNLDTMSYVETLFGHEGNIVDIVGLSAEKCISVGAKDRSARLWKVVEENQLVFRSGGSGAEAADGNTYTEGSIDCVAMVDEDTFVTGSDNGSICLWNVLRKKSIFTIPLAHGAGPFPELNRDIGEVKSKDARPQPRWITALATVPYSDLVLSASWDGVIRAWKVTPDRRRLQTLGAIGMAPVDNDLDPTCSLKGDGGGDGDDDASWHPLNMPPIRGIVNSISVFELGDSGKDGICIVVAASKEHRLGKWNKKAKGRCEGIVFEVKRLEETTVTNGVGST